MIRFAKKILFLQAPENEENKLKICFKVLGLNFLFLGIFSAIKLYAQEIGIYSPYKHPTNVDLVQTNSYLGVLSILFFSVLIHPFVEELSFRLWITKSKKKFFFGIAMSLTFFILIFSKIYNYIPLPEELSFHILFIFISLTVGFILLRIFKEKAFNPSVLILIIISSTLFSLVHVNVIGNQNNIIGYLIILFPYFISGYLYSFLNYRLGFGYSFLAHALHNLLLFSLALWIG